MSKDIVDEINIKTALETIVRYACSMCGPGAILIVPVGINNRTSVKDEPTNELFIDSALHMSHFIYDRSASPPYIIHESSSLNDRAVVELLYALITRIELVRVNTPYGRGGYSGQLIESDEFDLTSYCGLCDSLGIWGYIVERHSAYTSIPLDRDSFKCVSTINNRRMLK